jgi:hypothetical protein
MAVLLSSIIFLFLAAPTRAASTHFETLSEMLAQQEKLEAEANSSQSLAQINRAIAQKSREILLEKGFRVGEITQDPASPSVFRYQLLGGPENSHLNNVITEASEHFKIGYLIEVGGGLHYGEYDDQNALIRLSPKFLELKAPDMFNTILHETRHAYFWAKAGNGEFSPLNMDVWALDNTDLTGAHIYSNYFHFQELETHMRDFHQIMDGVPTNYLLDGFTPESAAIMKGETVLSFSDAVKRHCEAGIRSLQSGLASTGALDRNLKWSRRGMVLVVPVSEPGSQTPYANMRILMPGLGTEVPDGKVREKAIALLKETIRVAEKTKASAAKSLAEFKLNPKVGKPSCRELYLNAGLDI